MEGGVRVEMSLQRKETVEGPLARDGKGLIKARTSGSGRRGLIGVTSGDPSFLCLGFPTG